ncbi:MAG: bifunctional ornithine acetyltransferase/N-acetylglutamate synthase [Clostridia bacterium]|nr:bifunctional ornithine acetyltransferase/N-acetylglutamate synthase [Clostridia bacterium]
MRRLEIRGGRVIEGGLNSPKGFRLFCNAEAGILFSETIETTVSLPAKNRLGGRSVNIAKNVGGKHTVRAVVLTNCGADVLQRGARDRAVARVNYASDILGVPAFEVRPIFVGEVSVKADDALALDCIKECAKGLLSKEQRGLSALSVPTHTVAVQFYLGDDYLCTLAGSVFTDATCPATKRTILLTTDVAISYECLHTCLETELRDSFDLLEIPPAANDGVMFLASGLAGNNPIQARDVEYTKFAKALDFVLAELCGKMLSKGKRESVLRLKVAGATSKRLACDVVRNAYAYFLLSGSEEIPLIKGMISCIGGVDSPLKKNKMQVWLQSERGRLLLVSDGRQLFIEDEPAAEIFQGDKAEVLVDFQNGNYGASGWIPKGSRKLLNF